MRRPVHGAKRRRPTCSLASRSLNRVGQAFGKSKRATLENTTATCGLGGNRAAVDSAAMQRMGPLLQSYRALPAGQGLLCGAGCAVACTHLHRNLLVLLLHKVQQPPPQVRLLLLAQRAVEQEGARVQERWRGARGCSLGHCRNACRPHCWQAAAAPTRAGVSASTCCSCS